MIRSEWINDRRLLHSGAEPLTTHWSGTSASVQKGVERATGMTIQQDVARRSKSRTRVLMTATVIWRGGADKVLVRDVSRNGAQIYPDKLMSEGIDVCFIRGPIFVAAHIAWCRSRTAGIRFYRELSTVELDAAFQGVVFNNKDL